MAQESIRVEAPGSGANVGLHYDQAGVAYALRLGLIVRKMVQPGVTVVPFESRQPTPQSRIRGKAAQLAGEAFLAAEGCQDTGIALQFHEPDSFGFPTGGTGASAAESAAAILGISTLLDKRLTPTQLIMAAAAGEPGGHLDNVAPTIHGGFVFIDKQADGGTIFSKIGPPKDLGLLVGISSHQKAGGTEAARLAVQAPLPDTIQAAQDERSAMSRLALETGNTATFLRLVNSDEYHEPRRAAAGAYGTFDDVKLHDLRFKLFEYFGVSLAISGAGPSLQCWYDTRQSDKIIHDNGVDARLQSFMDTWFGLQRMTMKLLPMALPANGAHVIG